MKTNRVNNVLKEMDDQKVDLVVCLGDLVGYGPHPNEVIALIKRREIPCIKGNYDASVVDGAFTFIRDTSINSFSLPWNVEEVRASNKYYLSQLPTKLNYDINGVKVIFTHGSPDKISEYLFEDGENTKKVMDEITEDVLICAHTHIPSYKKFGNKVFINVGSVGKPKIGRPNATYALIEIKEGKTEKYYANLLAELYEKHGVNEFSFSPIVAVSPNGADPHHHSDKTPIKKGHSIVIDIGGVYNSYCSDMTRTVFFGEEPSERHAEIYNIVKEANLSGIKKVKEGVKFSEIDKAARDYIENAGYGEYFTHRTGHSIGIEDHDFGDVSSTNNEAVKEGMIFSIEPGIYLKDDIGVRIEDLVLVTKDGCEVLNSVTKGITII